MANIGLPSFDKTFIKTREWLRDVQQELNMENEERAYLALRAVLHALRDRLSVDESAELAAQLPMLVRGFYYEGYIPAGKPIKMGQHEFLERISRELTDDLDAGYVAKAVFSVMQQRVSVGEITDVKSNLPDDILELWPVGDRLRDEYESRTGLYE